jgi:hypothetical protein
MRYSSSFFLDLDDFLDFSCLTFSETASEISLLDPGAANINEDSIRPVKVLVEWVLFALGRSGLGVLDLERGGVLPGVLAALESV